MISIKKILKSRAHKKAQDQAESYAKSPEKIDELVTKAERKAKAGNKENGKQGPLTEFWEQLMGCFRLLKAYAKGDYREIPWQSLVMMIAAMIYFVMPLDFLPDFIAGAGYLDDAALLGWTLKAISSDIQKFLQWEDDSLQRTEDEKDTNYNQNVTEDKEAH